MLIYIVIALLLFGRVAALILAGDVIYRQIQLARRKIEPHLMTFRCRLFRMSLAIFALNIFPLVIGITYLVDPTLKPFITDPIGLCYSILYMALSLYIAYQSNENYRQAEHTESLRGFQRRLRESVKDKIWR